MQASGIDLALLRFALQHSDSPDAAGDTKVRPEDYEWLREAIKSYETDAQKMQKLLELAKKENVDVSEEQRRAALEELQYYVEDLDNATDFTKIGGLPITLQQIKESSDDTTRVWALWLLATAVQNHAQVQDAALTAGALDIATIALTSTSNVAVKQKALLAIIGLVKENKQAQRTFLDNNGVAHLTSLLSHPDPPARMKAAFFLAQLVSANSDAIEKLRSQETLAPLVAMVDDPNDDGREKAVALLTRLVEDAAVRTQCDALGLAGVARDRVRVIAQEVGSGSRSKEEAQEAMGVLMGLLKKVETK